MVEARVAPTATVLPDGRVLVAGGERIRYSETLSSAELYDPGTGIWAAAGSMAEARVHHTATLLSDGRVLVTGGIVDDVSGPILASAELYDPGSGSWSPTGSMAEVRSGHTATLLRDGRVLVTGANGSDTWASAELYNPGSGSWTPTGSLVVGRAGHTATLLSDGTVLVAGGYALGPSVGPLTSAEVYDPGSGSWDATGTMHAGHYWSTATRLLDGRVLIAGGCCGRDTQLYDPSSGSWTATGNMIEGRTDHAATLLLDGAVLVTGGCSGCGIPFASVELYDPGRGSWTETGNMIEARTDHTATLLLDGAVLLAGGYHGNGISLASAELYEPGR